MVTGYIPKFVQQYTGATIYIFSETTLESSQVSAPLKWNSIIIMYTGVFKISSQWQNIRTAKLRDAPLTH